MAQASAKHKKKEPLLLVRGLRELGLFLFSTFAVYLLIALATYNRQDPGWHSTGHTTKVENAAGTAGAFTADLMVYLFGYIGYVVPVLVFFLAYTLFRNRHTGVIDKLDLITRGVGFVLIVGGTTAFLYLHIQTPQQVLPMDSGGVLGTLIGGEMKAKLGLLGSSLFLAAFSLAGVTFFTGFSWFNFMEWVGSRVVSLLAWLQLHGHRRWAKMLEAAEERRLAREAAAASATAVREEVTATAEEGSASGLLRRLTASLFQRESANQSVDENEVAEPLARTAEMGGAGRKGAAGRTPRQEPAQDPQQEAKLRGPSAEEMCELVRVADALPDPLAESPNNVVPFRLPARSKVVSGVEPVSSSVPVPADELASGNKQEPTLDMDALDGVVIEAPTEGDPFSKLDDAIAEADAVQEAMAQELADFFAPSTEKQGERPNLFRTPVEEATPKMRRVMPNSETESFKVDLGELPDPVDGLPPLQLLDPPPESRTRQSVDHLEATSRLIEEKLKDFGIRVEVTEVHPGPVITRYELLPAAGVKVNQIVNLTKDLARALSTVSVRVVEVIAGRNTIGLEVPNAKRDIVYLSEVLRSKAYQNTKSPLTLGLGHDINGRAVVADLAKMPHLLVAGTTGSGKSVSVNTMILSLLFNATPEQVRMIMVDPKMLELSIYEGIPHLLAPVVTDMKDANNALRWCVAEMERRYKLMAAMGVRNIAGFNRKIEEAEAKGELLIDPVWVPEPWADEQAEPPVLAKLPYIVVVVDELADMMMVVGKKVEELIARLAQKARASGIHLILATQRPSVDVLTGLIKANIPTRIAFQVSSKIDSRTVLDQMGAESLLGNGDMLYLPPGCGAPERVHGAFVDDHEVHHVVDYLKQQFGAANYLDDILTGPVDGGDAFIPGENMGAEGGEQDPLYDEAVQFVLESRRASISSVQRKLKVGYNRAARMIEEMEIAGLVTPAGSNGQREVLAPNHE